MGDTILLGAAAVAGVLVWWRLWRPGRSTGSQRPRAPGEATPVGEAIPVGDATPVGEATPVGDATSLDEATAASDGPSRPGVATVVVDDEGIHEQGGRGSAPQRTRTRASGPGGEPTAPRGGELLIRWPAVQRLSVVVRAPHGVPLPTTRWAFVVEDRSGAMIAVPSEQSEALLAHTHRLPGFDHAALREALSGAAGSRFEAPAGSRRERWRHAIVPTGSRRVVTLFTATPER